MLFRLKQGLPLGAALLGVALFLGAASPARATLQMNFASTAGADIHFFGGTGTGGQFEFRPTVGNNFQITTTIGGTGSANGLLGAISTPVGGYHYGPIQVNGPVQTATVTGTGTVTIHDGAGHDYTATATWVDILTVGVGGFINTQADVNLTNASYTGTNADLITLRGNGTDIGMVSFQFTDTQHQLTDLAAAGADNATSYSGSLAPSVVPAPSGLALLGTGGAAAGLLGLLRRRRGVLQAA
jgi:hypothetical protein